MMPPRKPEPQRSGCAQISQREPPVTTRTHDLLRLFMAYLDRRGDPLVASFLDEIEPALAERELAPQGLACLQYLPRAAALAPGDAAPLAAQLAHAAEALRWGQTYCEADFGESFLDRYGWVELIGTRGHFASDSLAAGFLLLGPEITYPDHHHLAEEIYIPLTPGAEWSKGGRGFVARAAGEMIHHPSNVSHAMRTGREPLLALYLWRGGPLAQKSTVTGKA